MVSLAVSIAALLFLALVSVVALWLLSLAIVFPFVAVGELARDLWARWGPNTAGWQLIPTWPPTTRAHVVADALYLAVMAPCVLVVGFTISQVFWP
jgi:hypothetical protein